MRSVFKSQSQIQSQCGFDFDFNILTAFIWLGRAGPVRGRVPSIIIGIVPSILLLFDFDFTNNLPAHACNFHMGTVYLVMNRQDTAP